jgi:hypothetical protein
VEEVLILFKVNLSRKKTNIPELRSIGINTEYKRASSLCGRGSDIV